MAHRGRENADEPLAVLLAQGQTLRAAAATVGIGERTATRRWADPTFRKRVAELRGDMVERALGKMSEGMVEAAETMRGLLQANSEAVKLGAARSLLELGLKLRESVETKEQIRELEEVLDTLEQQQKTR